jgi:2-isopropylmalate synthase
VFDEDILALVGDGRGLQERLEFIALSVSAGTRGQAADLTMKIDGKEVQTSAKGNGPVDAIFNAIRALFPHEAELPLYQVHAVTGGTDAQAEVTVKLEQDGVSARGQSADVDTMVASARAYIYALNKLLRKNEKTAREVGP